jgi:hypothetical protein
MRRLVLLLLVGLAAPAAWSQGSTQAPAPEPMLDPPNVTIAERAAFYQRIATTESPAALERLARELAASPAEPWQRERIDAILERQFELDPARAARLAGELAAAGASGLVALLFDRLARDDVNAALAELSQIDDPRVAGVAALATLRGLGGDARAYELVAASLGGSARERFRADALAQLAVMSPGRALTEALQLRDPERRSSLAAMIVTRWAGDTPREALAAVDLVRDLELAPLLRSSVLRNWRDVDSLVAYLETLDTDAKRAALTGGVLDHLAREAPQRAAGLIAELPAGEERGRMLRQIGASYALQDPEAALEWAQSVDTPELGLTQGIVRSVAIQDPLRAFALADTLEEPLRSQGYAAAVNGPLKDQRTFAALADRVRGMETGQLRTALLVSLIGSWVNRPGNTAATLDWMLAVGADLPAEAFERVGFLYARADPAAAAAYVDRVPGAARASWVSAVAAGYATSDLQGAVAFVDRFRGEPAFDRAAVQLAQQLAAADPPGAARLLASVQTRGVGGLGPEIAIARAWAERDPAAAAQWALELPSMTGNLAMSIVTGAWTSQDPDAARAWALRLPQSAKRDAVLAAVVRGRGAAAPDATLLAAFSDDRARQGALMSTILATAQADAAAARRLIDSYLTEPRMRTQAEEMVAAFERGAAPLPAGAFGMVTAPAIGVPPPIPVGPVDVLFGPNGQAIGPNGQPMPVLRAPEPGLVPWPPDAISVPMQVPLPPPGMRPPPGVRPPVSNEPATE